MLKSDFSEDIVLLKKKPRERSQTSWMLSYADIVTVLLCFFIIFYSLEKNIEKRATNAIKGYATDQGILSKHTAPEVDTGYRYAIEALKELRGVEIVQSSSFVDIYFKEVVFFKPGSYTVSVEGKSLIDSIVSRLRQVDTKYRLEIQGHADKTPVTKSNKRWWKSNMELSVLRALKVYTYLIGKNMPKKHLSVAGYGHHKRLKPNIDQAIPENRRISLRLQLIEDN